MGISGKNYIERNKRLISTNSKKNSFYLTDLSGNKNTSVKLECTKQLFPHQKSQDDPSENTDRIRDSSGLRVSEFEARTNQEAEKQSLEQKRLFEEVNKLKDSKVLTGDEKRRYFQEQRSNIFKMANSMPEMYAKYMEYLHAFGGED